MKLSDPEHVVIKAIYHVGKNGIAPIDRVLKAVGYPKATTKKILIGLSDKGAVSLHRHDYAGSLSPDERRLLIRRQDRAGNWHYFGAVSVMKTNPKGKHLPGLPAKAQREYEEILKSAKASGRYKGREKEVAARTVKKQYKRIKVRNAYVDFVIRGQAKKTPHGWLVAGQKAGPRGKGKVIPQGRGVATLTGGRLLDRATGLVYVRKERNTVKRKKRNVQMMGGSGSYPIRASADYDLVRAGEAPSKKSRAHAAKKRRETQKKIKAAGGVKAFVGKRRTVKAAKKKAAHTKRHRKAVSSRKATTSRLAGRAIKKSAGLLKKTKKRNPLTGFEERKLANAARDAEAIRSLLVRARRDYKQARDVYHSYRRDRASLVELERATAALAYTQEQAKQHAREIAELKRRKKQKNPAPVLAIVNRAKSKAAQNRKEFAGEYKKDTPLYFPEGTPGGLSKLGRVLKIETQKVDVTPHTPTWLCRDARGRFHLGTTSKDHVIWNGPRQDFGKVLRIDYEDVKKHLGYNKPQGFYHFMGEDTGVKPTLYADGKGGLKFKGGAYSLEPRGIVN